MAELTVSFPALVRPAFVALVNSVIWLCRRPAAADTASRLRLAPAVGAISARWAALQLLSSNIEDGQCPECALVGAVLGGCRPTFKS